MRRRSAAILLTAAGGLAGLSSLALGATASVYDFNGGHGRYTSQLRQSGSKYEVASVTLVCTSTTYVSATPKATIKSSGAFSYSGSAALYSGPKKKAKTTLKVSGTISIAKKNGTFKASTTAKGCKSVSGKLTGYLVPVVGP